MELKLLTLQPELRPYEAKLIMRAERLKQVRSRLLSPDGSLSGFANGHLFYGLHRTRSGWVYREWAPAADALHLIGDFNGWDRQSHPLRRLPNGDWEIRLSGRDAIAHLSRYKVAVTARGRTEDRLPLYTFCTAQDPSTGDFAALVYAPPRRYRWHDRDFAPAGNVPPVIYEAHVGMASEEPRIATYREFADNVLPRIRRDGYNTVQLMAVMEHPYYGSFGYQVSNFFAPSSRFGSPDDLRYLIDKAHRMGISVFLDLVHSHAVRNTAEGICLFDGTVGQFFKTGVNGDHPAWGSKVFDYGKPGVIHFLLSNLKYWLEEFHFDGFRFDGVTSMLYRDHGLGVAFTDPDQYFSDNIDDDAVTYLQLATELVRTVKPSAVLIAEDVSAMPGMCVPVRDGGIGFDYRLSMGLPDYFVRTVKERPDGSWYLGQFCWELTASRNGEKRIAYVESHDQAIVGDQTLMFRLAGAEMYTGMRKTDRNMAIDRAIALHKMIRLAVICAGGEGYLNFMGNEFGHPEWIDFPREGNGWNYHYCRRQWSLADDPALRYGQLGDFDRAMLRLVKSSGVLSAGKARILSVHEAHQLLVIEHGGLVFAFNFHPTRAETDLSIDAPSPGQYRTVLTTDERRFGGFDRVSRRTVYETYREQRFTVYLPPRTAAVLEKI